MDRFDNNKQRRFQEPIDSGDGQKAIQKYNSKKDFVLKEIEEFETISVELDKIIN